MKGLGRPFPGWLPAALALVAALGCRAPASAPDVLVITLDTARADRFSYAGDSPVATPRIDALAAEGTVFLGAVSPAPITLVAHASLFTGRLPPAHGVRNNGSYRLGETATTLAELLREQGYRTAAFVGAAVLDSRYGLNQGFDHYDDEVYGRKYHPQRRGEEVARAALAWLRRQTDDPVFVWVHLFDPHTPYEPPEPERSRYRGSPYDGEIAYCDRVVGDLLSNYRQLGRGRQPLIVLTSDHGEALGEHGEETHGVLLHDAVVRVPLLIRAPGVGAGRRIADQVELIDVVPTLAELLRLSLPPGTTGRSLVPLMTGKELAARPAYLETLLPLENFGWAPLRGLRTGGWKLVEGPDVELFDLRRDPRELDDQAPAKGAEVARLRRQLELLAAAPPVAVAERLELDPDTRRQLVALGYLAVAPAPPAAGQERPPSSLPHPRDRVHVVRAQSTLTELFDRGFHRGALERAEALLEEDPTNLWLRRQLLKMLLASGSVERAEETARAALASGSDLAWVAGFHGLTLEALGRPATALAAYRQAIAADPGSHEARRARWELLLAMGRREVVAAEAGAALTSAAASGAAAALIRSRWPRAGDERLVEELRAALSRRPDDPDLLAALGDALVAGGRPREALVFHNRAQRLEPDEELWALKLTRTLHALGRAEGVRQVLRNVRTRGLLRPALWLRLGEACMQLEDLPCAAAAMRRVSALVPGSLTAWLEAERRRWPGVGEDPGAAAAGGVGELGRLLYLAGRYSEAAAAFARAAVAAPGDPGWEFAMGRAWERAGGAERALRAYARALAVDPRHRPARTGSWRLLSRLGRNERLAGEARLALAADPADGEARAALARTASGGGAEAVAAALAAQLAELPDSAVLLTALADHRPASDAAALYRRALTLVPGDPDALLGLARLGLGEQQAGTLRPGLRRLYRRRPLEFEAALAFAEACARLGEWQELREVLSLLTDRLLNDDGDWRGAVGPDPELAPLRAAAALTRIGTAGWDGLDYWTAVHAYAAAVELVPDDARLLYNLGLAWERVGDYGEALAAFDRTLEADPRFPRAPEHRQAVLRLARERGIPAAR